LVVAVVVAGAGRSNSKRNTAKLLDLQRTCERQFLATSCGITLMWGSLFHVTVLTTQTKGNSTRLGAWRRCAHQILTRASHVPILLSATDLANLLREKGNFNKKSVFLNVRRRKNLR
jgi:hypothetical protein